MLLLCVFFNELNKLDTGRVEAYQIYLILFIVAHYFYIPNCDIRYCYWLSPNEILIYIYLNKFIIIKILGLPIITGRRLQVRLVDAGFIWTEPHSKRLKVKLTIQKEVMNGAMLQQTFVVEFVVHNQMCDDCHRVEAKDFWRACVQVRQKVGPRA